MGSRAGAGNVARIALALAVLPSPATFAAPLTHDELVAACAKAEGPAHCGRNVEEIQLKRLPNLATREGNTLTVSLYPTGTATFTDTEALNGGRSYALWDFVSEINAVVLFANDGANSSFVVLQRTNGRRVDLPSEPKVSPDRSRLVTADFCASNCVNELAVWRVTKDGVQKELTWKPAQRWDDAGVSWKNADTLVVEYTPAGAAPPATLERRLTDAGWRRADDP
ncbi:MAG: hypothetical protein ABI569_02585 [Casimicrobiaceae bacterium]